MKSEEQKYRNFLKGKRVILVGPSWHLKNSRQGEFIDSYDVVVRMNLGYKIPSSLIVDMGKRVDVLYTTVGNFYIKNKYFTSEIMEELSFHLKWICVTSCPPHRISFGKLKEMNKKANIPIRNIYKEDYKKLIKKTTKKPTCGMVSIIDLLRYDIGELYITGLTFYDTKVIDKRVFYYSTYRNDNMKYSKRPFYGHNLNGELRILKEMKKIDKRIKCDDVLIKIMDQNKVSTKKNKVKLIKDIYKIK